MIFNFNQTNWSILIGSPNTKLITPENHTSNDFYGQASVLKRYADLPASTSFKFVLEHGLCFSDRIWNKDLEAQYGTVLPPTTRRASLYKKASTKVAIPIGFGYLYAMDLVRDRFGDDPRSEHRRGTIVFPCHSTHSIATKFDHESYARRLANLDDEFHPIVICGYWKDLQNGIAKIYQSVGMEIVTSGHMYDKEFMLRFHDICRNFRYSVSNALGSHLFQSVASGCQFFFVASDEIKYQIPAKQRKDVALFDALYVSTESEAHQLFAHPNKFVTQEQLKFVDQHLGISLKRSKKELRNIIRDTNWRDLTAPCINRLSCGLSLKSPPAVARLVDKPLRTFLRMKTSIRKRLVVKP